ncbi:MAG: hypothetical protein M3456_12175 [Actinomycetota bacterium]|nr:hypothetical protein [Actinomycetota bacterium]
MTLLPYDPEPLTPPCEELERWRDQLDYRQPLPRTWARRLRRELEAEAVVATTSMEGAPVTVERRIWTVLEATAEDANLDRRLVNALFVEISGPEEARDQRPWRLISYLWLLDTVSQLITLSTRSTRHLSSKAPPSKVSGFSPRYQSLQLCLGVERVFTAATVEVVACVVTVFVVVPVSYIVRVHISVETIKAQHSVYLVSPGPAVHYVILPVTIKRVVTCT